MKGGLGLDRGGQRWGGGAADSGLCLYLNLSPDCLELCVRREHKASRPPDEACWWHGHSIVVMCLQERGSRTHCPWKLSADTLATS